VVGASSPFKPRTPSDPSRIEPKNSGKPPVGKPQAASGPGVPPRLVSAEAAIAAAGSAPAPRPMGLGGRVFWLGLSATFLAAALSLFIFNLVGSSSSGDRALVLSFSAASAGYFAFASRVGWARAWPGFLRVARWFLTATFLNAAACSAICLLFFGLDDAQPALFFLIFSLVFALFLALLPGRLGRAKVKAYAAGTGPPAGSPGWGALGALLVTLGISLTLGSALLASGLGEAILRDTGVPRLKLEGFVGSQMHLLAGALLFLPGLFCVLHSRQDQGASHVFRGALGFGTAGALVFVLSQLIQFRISADATGSIEFHPVGGAWLAGLFGMGILAALLLFWPGKATRPQIE
jgi:hypothetical protein